MAAPTDDVRETQVDNDSSKVEAPSNEQRKKTLLEHIDDVHTTVAHTGFESDRQASIALLIAAISSILLTIPRFDFEIGSNTVVGSLNLFFGIFSVVGAFLALKTTAEGTIGGEWSKGLNMIPDIFSAVGGMICALPVVIPVAKAVLDPAAYYILSTPAHAICSLLDPDMQSGTAAKGLIPDINVWYPSSVMSYYLGDFIAFSLPVALLIIQSDECRRYLLLGVIPGFVTLPISVATTYVLMYLQNPLMVNSIIEANPVLDTTLEMNLPALLLQATTPCLLISIMMIVMLKINEDALVRAFISFGEGLNLFLRASFMLSIIQHIGGIVWVFEAVPFLRPFIMQPVMMNAQNKKYFTVTDTTGLEVASSIGISLSGMLPFIFILKEHYLPLLRKIGRSLGFDSPDGAGILGVIGCLSSMMVLFHTLPRMTPKESIKAVSFGVSVSYILGGHLAYSSQYQPPLVIPLMAGKLVGGLAALLLSVYTTAKMVDNEDVSKKKEVESIIKESLIAGPGGPEGTLNTNPETVLISERVTSGLKRIEDRFSQVMTAIHHFDHNYPKGEGIAPPTQSTVLSREYVTVPREYKKNFTLRNRPISVQNPERHTLMMRRETNLVGVGGRTVTENFQKYSTIHQSVARESAAMKSKLLKSNENDLTSVNNSNSAFRSAALTTQRGNDDDHTHDLDNSDQVLFTNAMRTSQFLACDDDIDDILNTTDAKSNVVAFGATHFKETLNGRYDTLPPPIRHLSQTNAAMNLNLVNRRDMERMSKIKDSDDTTIKDGDYTTIKEVDRTMASGRIIDNDSLRVTLLEKRNDRI